MTEFIMDEISHPLIKTLIQNPERLFNKKELAEEAEVSRDALYRRWDSIEQLGILKEKGTRYKLNQESDATSKAKAFLNLIDSQIA